jgi:micrococcal nuclease
MSPEDALFRYKAKVIRVIDGDTIEAEIDHGCRIFSKRKIRLHGIDSPELRGAEKADGMKSASHLIQLITLNALNRDGDNELGGNLANIYIHTHKDKTGKYGRYLAVLFGITDNGDLIDINKQMVDDGYAEEDKR